MANYCDSMALRILTAFFVVSLVFPICYYAWFWAFTSLVPPDFGMPAYENEIELTFLVSLLPFSVVPVLISIKVIGFLNRRLLIRCVGPET